MPGEFQADLAIRPAPLSNHDGTRGASSIAIPIARDASSDSSKDRKKQHKHARSSYSEASPLVSRTNSLTFRPMKRPMPTPAKTIAIINASGRQAASLIRYATAVGYHVRAQMRNRLGVIATEVATNENVTVLEGELYTREARAAADKSSASSSPEYIDVTKDGSFLPGIGVNYALISELFCGAQLAFINTTFYGDEFKIGKALADAAKKAGIQHYVYSSMPDHHEYHETWPSLPLWAIKHKVEKYIFSIGLPATFVYTGIYNNNFTSLRYPLFCMELQPDGSFIWQAPFHPDAKLPWLDAEHDVGPAILQIFQESVTKWGRGQKIALAYEMLSPIEACRLFSRGVGRLVTYRRGPIEVHVPIPAGYRSQLKALEQLFLLGGDDQRKQPPYFGSQQLDSSVPSVAMQLWEGPRGIEEYAREVFPLEEQANGLTWMLDDGLNGSDECSDGGDEINGNASTKADLGHCQQNFSSGTSISNVVTENVSANLRREEEVNSDGENLADAGDEDGEDDDGLIMRVTARDDEEWLP